MASKKIGTTPRQTLQKVFFAPIYIIRCKNLVYFRLLRIFAETNSKLMRKALLSIPKKFGLQTFVIVCILTACSKKDEKAHCIMPAGTTLEEGDIVLRKGTGLTSRAVRIADGGSDFSHCGIIVDSCGRKMVVHAVPDEPDFEGDVDRVKMERPEDFFSTIRASKGCVLRSQDRETAEKSARLAYGIYKRGTLFDDDYNDSDTTKMYCSQLVAHVYQKCGIDITNGIRHDAILPGVKFSHVIYPSDFLRCRRLKRIVTFQDAQ